MRFIEWMQYGELFYFNFYCQFIIMMQIHVNISCMLRGSSITKCLFVKIGLENIRCTLFSSSLYLELGHLCPFPVFSKNMKTLNILYKQCHDFILSQYFDIHVELCESLHVLASICLVCHLCFMLFFIPMEFRM